MRFKCKPDWWDNVVNYICNRLEEYAKQAQEWHDYFMFYGKVDGVCVLFETVERRLHHQKGKFTIPDVWYWKYRLKEK